MTAMLSTLGIAFRWLMIAVFGLIVAVYLMRRLRRAWVVRQFKTAFPGKDVLFTYSNSPHWQHYIETHWLNRWRDRSVVFNRSLPWRRNDPHVRLWITFTGVAEHTPSAIVLSPHTKPRVIPFFKAFRDLKHGRIAKLRDAEAKLAVALDANR
ncbi:MAG: hypothetical protein ABI681_03700 [Gemmatimonadales bacterium]